MKNILNRSDRRFAILLNRFRWEDAPQAHGRRDYERVQAVLLIEDVMAVRSQGVPKGDADTILSLLALEFRPGEDGTGEVLLTQGGPGGAALSADRLRVDLGSGRAVLDGRVRTVLPTGD